LMSVHETGLRVIVPVSVSGATSVIDGEADSLGGALSDDVGDGASSEEQPVTSTATHEATIQWTPLEGATWLTEDPPHASRTRIVWTVTSTSTRSLGNVKRNLQVSGQFPRPLGAAVTNKSWRLALVIEGRRPQTKPRVTLRRRTP
jgi:hypothetical protein